jgi:periplasmic copper chaperone A
MNHLPQRRIALRAGLAAGAACATWALPARACEFHGGTLRVTHPWTRATAADATVAVLGMRIDEVSEDDRLIGARSPVAQGAEMGGADGGRPVDVAIPTGSVIELHDSGVHLRLTGLKQPLQVGREYPLELVFERSGLLLARLSVDFTVMRFR